VWATNPGLTGASIALAIHAKAVIVDGQVVLVTSANLTNAAYDKSLELGILCRGGGIKGDVSRSLPPMRGAGRNG
jgi:phosphatidylserine/phosphatidylglycerophosphate/cardiolipin synthase-like enzyme